MLVADNGPFNLIRLNADGNIDPTFAPVDGVFSIVVPPDGGLVVSGSFPNGNGSSTKIARLYTEARAPVLRVVNPLRQAERFTVTVPLATAGAKYILEFKHSIGELNWSQASALNGADSLQMLSDTSATNGHRFYRVRAE